MNKSELIEEIAVAADLSKSKAGQALEAVIDSVKKSLAKGEDVTIPGFGTFTLTERAARTGRNPQTGETIQIAATKSPRFRPSKGLKDAVG